MTNDPANLELSPDEMLGMGENTVRRLVQQIVDLQTQPACGDVAVEELCRQMREPAPEIGQAFSALLDQLLEEWTPHSFTTPGPGYLAFIPGGGLFPSALADFIAGSINRYTGVWQASPCLVQLEANALDWLRDWMGFPQTARGLLTTGGSMANFNAIVCARELHLGPEIRNGVIYTSSQAHHSVVKSAKLAGIMPDRVRKIPVDRQFRLRVEILEQTIATDRRAGLTPFLVVSTAGTMNTGAVDPLDLISALCSRERLWHHTDGAYGAFFHMCPELRPLLQGLSGVDSLTLDPHKGMFLPYGTGALLVRDGAALRHAHAATAGYLPTPPNAEEFYDPSQHGPELSRGFPGLRVWLPVKIFGMSKFRAAIAEKRTLAVETAERISKVPGVVLVAPPQLSLFAFHLTWQGASREQENAGTQELLDRVRKRNRVMLTGCWVEDRFLARVCVLSFRTRRQHMDICVTDVAEETANVISARYPASDAQQTGS